MTDATDEELLDAVSWLTSQSTTGREKGINAVNELLTRWGYDVSGGHTLERKLMTVAIEAEKRGLEHNFRL